MSEKTEKSEFGDLEYLFRLGRRYVMIVVVPVIIAAFLAIPALLTSPVIYSATALITLQDPAGQNNASLSGELRDRQRQQVVEQVATLEAWLKSEYVLTGLLMGLDGFVASDPVVRTAQLNRARRELSLSTVGNYSIEFKLERAESQGLAKKLEAVVARLLEGLTVPEKNIMNAHQFVQVKRKEAFDAAQESYFDALRRYGGSRAGDIGAQVVRLDDLRQSLVTSSQAVLSSRVSAEALWSIVASGTLSEASLLDGISQLEARLARSQQTAGGQEPAQVFEREALNKLAEVKERFAAYQTALKNNTELLEQIESTKRAISDTANVVQLLETRYLAFKDAREQYQQYQTRFPDERVGNSLGLFHSPHNIVLMGRPQDPSTGKSSGTKIALGILLAGGMIGMVLAFIRAFFDDTIYEPADFANVSPLPIVAVLPSVGEATPAGAALAVMTS